MNSFDDDLNSQSSETSVHEGTQARHSCVDEEIKSGHRTGCLQESNCVH
jgi:hypothetical protein